MSFIRLKVAFVVTVVVLLNFTLLSNSQAFIFSLKLHCIGGDCPVNPLNETPYVETIDVSFSCSKGLICTRGSFFFEDGFGGGYWVSIGTLFYASWDGKVESLNLFGFWIDGVMFGFGNVFYFEDGYNFLFTGHKIPEFDY